MERKIIKVGNSLGVIIPSSYLEDLKVSHGDTVELDFSKEIDAIVISNKNTTSSANHFEKVIKDVVDEYLQDKGL